MSQPSSIDDSTFSVTRTVRIAAPRDLVFAVLTEPSQIGQWFGQRADFPNGVREGALGTFGWTAHGDFPARIERYRPSEEFAFTWGSPGEPIADHNSTTASFTLLEEPGEQGPTTVLTVIESGFDTLGEASDQRAAMEENAQGWSEELDDLARHVAGLAQTPGTGLTPHTDIDAGRIVRSVLVRAPRQVAWEALVDPAAIEAWWGHPAVFPDGMRAGSAGTFEWVGHGLMPMVIERFDPPRSFHLRWGDLGEESPGDDASLVEFSLASAGPTSTLVTVVETGFDHLDGAAKRAAIEENVGGWTMVLDGYVRYAEATRRQSQVSAEAPE